MIVLHILLAIFALIVYYAVGTVVCCVFCDESVSGEDDHLMMAVIAMWPLVLFGFLICLPARLLVELINKLRK